MDTISIYIHWPFCDKKCPYCDFNSFVNPTINHATWTQAYLRVIQHEYQGFLSRKTIKSIFFGGGTPSLAKPSMIGAIIDALKSISNFAENIEITLEANPTSVETKKFAEFKKAGINRVSLGIQSLRDNNLRFLGRNHSAKDSISAIEAVKESFSNYSLDLIYALPQQTVSEWQDELEEAISLAAQHLSLYQLTIENGTKFGLLAKQGLLKEINEEIAAEMFEVTSQITEKNHLYRYEVSNHAKPGYESIHNINYWMYGDYIGIGPGAHGRYTTNTGKAAVTDIKQPDTWLQQAMSEGNGIETCQYLTTDDIRMEKIMVGMRTRQGVEKRVFEGKEETVEAMIEDGMIVSDSGRISATSQGLSLLNSLVAMLV